MTSTIRRLAAGLTISLTLGLAACQSMELQLSLLVPENVDPRRVDLSRSAEGERVEVDSDTPIVLLFPVGGASLAEMATEATEGRDDLVLVDIEVERSFWWAVLFGNVHRRMRALRVPLPVAPEPEAAR